MNLTKTVSTTVFISLCMIYSVYAETQNDALSIIENVYNRVQPKDQEGTLTMSLINLRGEERVRKIHQFIRDDGSTEKKIMFFISPADVRNTSFMNWSYKKSDKDDDQWIYLPALKKTKRISSEGKSDYFMGSDFTYDDLGDRQPDEDVHTVVKKELINGTECTVVKSVSKDRKYMYGHTLTWIDTNKWIGVRKEFYDTDGNHIKSLEVKKSEKIDTYWMITHTEMVNHKTKHRTRMVLNGLELDKGISESQFNERTMTRGL